MPFQIGLNPTQVYTNTCKSPIIYLFSQQTQLPTLTQHITTKSFNKFTLIPALLLFLVLSTSCEKEGVYPVEDDVPVLMASKHNLASPEALYKTLPDEINGFTTVKQATEYYGNVPSANISFEQVTNKDASLVYVSVADFKQYSSRLESFLAGNGLHQVSAADAQRFGLQASNSSAANVAYFGYDLTQSSSVEAASLGDYANVNGSFTKERLQLSQSTDAVTNSYITPYKTLLSDVAGWEIFDAKNNTTMLLLVVDERFAFALSSTEQPNAKFVGDLVTAARASAIMDSPYK